ncbi:1-acyl-sn-glycerol-3-phosphate acyltransferase [Nitrogeniibacter aestuarii]|uniref:1-acyl-sn-glycerol-3-phosphate acyltransferase n=1 Tax=Nitrogeniibacter aestuarii TaxID=2815343 RepID=UPI001E65515B|nr:1-acyl-sn-glycerol-3-phosphate acyltransferase [Nitrogeniibacter aestuarii]
MSLTSDPDQRPLPTRPRSWAIWLMRRIGWSLSLPAPPGPRFVLIMYPHTSNWDFFIAIVARYASGWPVKWLGKHTLFLPPFGRLFSAMGGIPVNRTTPGSLLQDLTRYCQTHDHAIIGIAPEGTRSHVACWKSGFHRIARAADIPIALGYIDYRRRTIGVLDYMPASDDFAADIDKMAERYAGITGRHPAAAGRIAAR